MKMLFSVLVVLVLSMSVVNAQNTGVQKLLDPISLDSPVIEFSAVTGLSPSVVGIGGAISYKVASNSSGDTAFWADLGGMSWNNNFNIFLGGSTNLPFGGRTLTENTRVGGGYQFQNEMWFFYLRAPF